MDQLFWLRFIASFGYLIWDAGNDFGGGGGGFNMLIFGGGTLNWGGILCWFGSCRIFGGGREVNKFCVELALGGKSWTELPLREPIDVVRERPGVWFCKYYHS